MNKDSLKNILDDIASGRISPEKALAEISSAGVADLGFAKIDTSRKERCGFPEFIFGEGKEASHLVSIIRQLDSQKECVLATRISPEQAAAVLKEIPSIHYDSSARILLLNPPSEKRGNIYIVSAGTTDLPVVLEAKYTAEACGCQVTLMQDAGVAGIHRLLSRTEDLRKADVIIAVAGMEGALPSVIGGLVPCPVIAVPTSVGYGANLGGFTAMLAMLNSCASGVTVVNINNGFGAGCAAARIIHSLQQA